MRVQADVVDDTEIRMAVLDVNRIALPAVASAIGQRVTLDKIVAARKDVVPRWRLARVWIRRAPADVDALPKGIVDLVVQYLNVIRPRPAMSPIIGVRTPRNT